MIQERGSTSNTPIYLEVPVMIGEKEIAKATVNFTVRELQNLQSRRRRGGR